jgi:lipopolysaccharide transport system permease protein
MNTLATLSIPRYVSRQPIWGFAWTLVRTDFKARYHGTIGGFAWALLRPLAMFAVLFSVFSYIFGGDPTYRANLILGVFLYEFFGESTKTGFISLASKSFLLTKAKFPSWIVVAASSANAVITLALFSCVFTLFLLLAGHGPGPLGVALFLLYLACFYVTVLGISLGASVLFLRYRDLNQVWEIIVHAGFFVAPIIYPLSVLPERLHFYLYFWPPTPIIQFARMALVDGTPPSLRAHALLLLQSGVIFAIGRLIFRRHAPRAVEYL